MLWPWPRASTTRTTGAPSSAATWAVEPLAGPPATASRLDAAVEQPHHAFDDGDVGADAAVPVERTDQSSPTSTGSRLRPGRPVASAW